MIYIKKFKTYSEFFSYLKRAISKRNVFLKYIDEEKDFIQRSFEIERKREYMDSLITNPNTSMDDMRRRIRDIDNCEELVISNFPQKYREDYETIKKLDEEIGELTEDLRQIDSLKTKTNREWIVIIINILGDYSFRPIQMNGIRILAFVKNNIIVDNLTNEEYVMLSSSKDIIYYDKADMIYTDVGKFLDMKKTLSCFFPLNDEVNEVLFKEYLSLANNKKKERK